MIKYISLITALATGFAFARTDTPLPSLNKEVRHELVMLPYLGVFDNLEYRVDGSVVTLSGQVTRPTLKADAGRVVKRIEGVHGR
jgi:hyperosmotically inducible protein